MEFMKEKFLNKEVQIYPGDTYYKYGIVRDINEGGVVFEITRSVANDFTPGALAFVAWSARLIFELVDYKK
jgi:hypothetical protein